MAAMAVGDGWEKAVLMSVERKHRLIYATHCSGNASRKDGKVTTGVVEPEGRESLR